MQTRPGPVAQLVERHVYTVDVVGSRPAGPTAGSTFKPLAVISASARAPSRAGPAYAPTPGC
ncbi:Glutaconyl-CoA decarboxylase subunit gamma (fragment) [Phycicoccus elongatus Lp2]|uniref:Glutaconyl-CoA decarboxylase subunit gamma n=1 Tax=Phycicoccus elongatus Lp2 TaxID=1193181 RepID=N0E1Z9_9MICO